MLSSKVFYHFPFVRYPKNSILYSDSLVLKSKIFETLSFNLFSDHFALAIFKWPAICYTSRIFNSELEYVPEIQTRLLYRGSESVLAFSLEHDGSVSRVFRREKSKYVPMKFLGYPIGYKDYREIIDNRHVLSDFLFSHWVKIKSGESNLHGDLNIYNVLLLDGVISCIDSYPVNNSPIFDHFYYYTSVLSNHKLIYPFQYADHLELTMFMNDLMKSVFSNESITALQDYIGQIKVNTDKLSLLKRENVLTFARVFNS